MEPVASCSQLSLSNIESSIVTIRGQHVLLDRNLAEMYQVDVGYMNRQVKRNIKRFPPDFMFQLTKEEYDGLKCHFGISNLRGGDRRLPFAFTEQGVSMLSGLLRSDIAIEANILIMRAFVAMRHFLISNAQIFQRMDRMELRQLDINKHNAQYPAIEVKEFKKSHDRFLILDKQVYLIGASLKDLGKKWFALSLMSETAPDLLLSRL